MQSARQNNKDFFDSLVQRAAAAFPSAAELVDQQSVIEEMNYIIAASVTTFVLERFALQIEPEPLQLGSGEPTLECVGTFTNGHYPPDDYGFAAYIDSNHLVGDAKARFGQLLPPVAISFLPVSVS